MKASTLILPVTLILLLIVTSVFASNVLLKKEYDKVDKSDLYMIDVKTFVFAKYGF
ncbi:MAG: hypothetical protein WKG06_01650 [Segetibacter sp.]